MLDIILGSFVALVVLALVIAFQVKSPRIDKRRIATSIRRRGGRVISIREYTAGRDLFGEHPDRRYEVLYVDSEGKQHSGTCKASLLLGIHWTDKRSRSASASGWLERPQLDALNAVDPPDSTKHTDQAALEPSETEAEPTGDLQALQEWIAKKKTAQL